jgi:hypothetical protein
MGGSMREDDQSTSPFGEEGRGYQYRKFDLISGMSLYIERNNPGGSGDPSSGGFGQSQNRGNQGGMQSGMQHGSQPGGLQARGNVPGQPSGGFRQQQGSTMPQQGTEQQQNGGQPGANGERDYRDDLRSLLDKAHAERGLTRYRLCKQMGIDSGTLSNVLAKRRHVSLEKLEQILSLLGYRLTFSPKEGANGMAQ